MSTSLIPTVLTAMVSRFDSALSIEVRDGHILQNLEEAGLLIGSDGEQPVEIPIDQEWAGAGHVTRNETFEVPCFLFTRTGDAEAVSATKAPTIPTTHQFTPSRVPEELCAS